MATIKYQDFTLDIDKSSTLSLQQMVNGRLGDHLLTGINVTITENREPFDLTGYSICFEGVTSEGTTIFDEEHIEPDNLMNGKFRYSFSDQIFSSLDRYKTAYFSFVKGDKRATSENFIIVVQENADITLEEAERFTSLANQLIQECNRDWDLFKESKEVDYQAFLREKLNEIDELISSVKSASMVALDMMNKVKKGIEDFAVNAVSEMSEKASEVNKTADAEITKIQSELPRVESELSGLTADLAVADDKLQDIEARQDVLEQELIDGQYCDLQTLAEFSSGKQLDVAMDHKVGEVFARNLSTTNLLYKSTNFKTVGINNYSTASYLSRRGIAKAWNPREVDNRLLLTIPDTILQHLRFATINDLSLKGSDTLVLTIRAKASVPLSVRWELSRGQNGLNVNLPEMNLNEQMTTHQMEITGKELAQVDGVFFSSSLLTSYVGETIEVEGISLRINNDSVEFENVPEDYGIVHGQPNLLDGSSLEGRKISVSWYTVLQNYDLLSPDCSVKPGDTVTLIARVFNDGTHMAGLRGRWRVNGTYRDTLGERFNDKKIALTMKIPKDADWFQFCINTGVELHTTWIIAEEQLLKGKFTENESWTPSQKDSGLVPVNDGYVTADKAETVVYGSKAAHRVKLSLTDHFKSQHNGKVPADLLDRTSNLKLSGTVKSADGCEITDSAGNVLFESSLAETAFSLDLPV